MKIIMIILHLANGEVAKIPAQLAIGEFCSDKVEEYTKFIENKNYIEGNGEPWIYRYYEDKKVLLTYCQYMDGKYLIHYNVGEACTKK